MGLLISLRTGVPIGTIHEGRWFRFSVANRDRRAATRVIVSVTALEPRPPGARMPALLSPVISDFGPMDIRPGSSVEFHFCSLLMMDGHRSITIAANELRPGTYMARLSLEEGAVERATAAYGIFLGADEDLAVKVVQSWRPPSPGRPHGLLIDRDGKVVCDCCGDRVVEKDAIISGKHGTRWKCWECVTGGCTALTCARRPTTLEG